MIYSLTQLIPELTTLSGIDPFFFQAGGHRRQPNLASVFLVCFVLCVLQFFITNPRDWLGRMSPKLPILFRVGRKLYLINQSMQGRVRLAEWEKL